MDINFYNLDRVYWDKLQLKYPGYVDHFLNWVDNFLSEKSLVSFSMVMDISDNEIYNKKPTLFLFYSMPFCFQAGLFYEYLSIQTCDFEINVTDYDEVIDSIQNYFAETRENDLMEKSNDKVL